MAPTSQADFLAALERRVAQCWCMEPWTEVTHVPVQMDCCKQLTGTECIKQWVNSNAVNNNKCPHCRQELFKKEGTPSSSPQQTPTAAAPLLSSEPSFHFLLLPAQSLRPLPIQHQPASAAARPPPPAIGHSPTSIGAVFQALQATVSNTGYREEARCLWKIVFTRQSVFQRLWAEIQVKPRWPLAGGTKWHYMVALLHSVVQQEQTLAARAGNTQHAYALDGYLYYLDRLPTHNLAHTEEHARAIVASGPLFDCVDFMMTIFNLVYHMQPTYISADTLLLVMDNIYYGHGDSDQPPDWRSWDYIFGDAVSMRRDRDVPTLRILTVLLMCHPLPVVKRTFGTDSSRFAQYDRRCLDVVSTLRIRLSMMPRDRLEDMAKMSDRELLSSWFVV